MVQITKVKGFAVGCILMASAPAFAINTYDASQLTCKEVSDVIQKEGMVYILSHWQNCEFFRTTTLYVRDEKTCAGSAYTVDKGSYKITAADTDDCYAPFPCLYFTGGSTVSEPSHGGNG